MKRTNIYVWALAIALAAACVPLAPAFSAQSQNQTPSVQQQRPQKKARTYLGEIVKTQSGRYGLLTDKKHGRGYLLDDQADAKKYARQNVLVTGIVNPQTKTLHVEKIKPAPHH